MQLFVKSGLSLDELAKRVKELALSSYETQLRDGLNLGGGEYFKFSGKENTILLVSNDTDHLEIFIESMAAFPYYFYLRSGSQNVLQDLHTVLSTHGLECELGDYSQL